VKALVTGASGFVGSAVLRHLVAAGHEVRVLMRPTSDRRNIEGVACEPVIGDLTDRASLRAAAEGCEAVFNVAADYRLWVRNADEMHRANFDGTRNVLLAAAEAGARRIVHTSSVAAVGNRADGAPADEDNVTDVARLVGPYKRSKYLSDVEARRLAVEEGVPVVVVNPAAPFGPRDIKPTPTGRMVVEFGRGRMPAYIDTGLNVVHVDDVAHGHLLAHARGVVGERYILGGENMTLRDILGVLAAHLGRSPPRIRLPRAPLFPIAWIAEAVGRVGGVEPALTRDALRMAKQPMYYSSDKAKRELGYAPRPGAEALRDAADWYRENGYFRD
jgi:dihydroflavonol-4-reductase